MSNWAAFSMGGGAVAVARRADGPLARDGRRLPADLAAIRHAAASTTRDALEPLPLLDPEPCPFATRAEERLRATLLAHHGAAPADTLAA